jgi:hypothetical protein
MMCRKKAVQKVQKQLQPIRRVCQLPNNLNRNVLVITTNFVVVSLSDVHSNEWNINSKERIH